MYCGSTPAPTSTNTTLASASTAWCFPPATTSRPLTRRPTLPFVALVQQSGGEWTHAWRDGRAGLRRDDALRDGFHSDTPFLRGEFHFHLGTPEEGTHTFCVDNAVLKVHPTDYATGGAFDGATGAWSVTGASRDRDGRGLCLAVPRRHDARATMSRRASTTSSCLPSRLHARYDAAGAGVAGAGARYLARGSRASSTCRHDGDRRCRRRSTSYSVLRRGAATPSISRFELGGGAGGEVCLDNVQLLSGGQPPRLRARNRPAGAREPTRL